MQNTQNNTRINIYLQKYSFSLITKDFHSVGFSSQDVSRLRSRRQPYRSMRFCRRVKKSQENLRVFYGSRCNLKFRRREEDFRFRIRIQPETICIENIQTTMERDRKRERGGNSGGDGVAATPEPAQRSRKHAKTVFQNCRNSQ